MTSIDGPATEPLLDVRALSVEYAGNRGGPSFRAVSGVDLAVKPGETLGLVGESGSGKSTIGRAVLGLTPISEGTIYFRGKDITHARGRVRRVLGEHLQVVFQDPYSSLNPTRTIRQTLLETIRAHQMISPAEAFPRVAEMLAKVGLEPSAATRYPSQFSGGQRQRIAIARALIVRPSLVICDEPVSALDLSVQAQVLNLLKELQEEFKVGYLFISHDLAVVRHIANRIAVLYSGQIVEQGEAASVYSNPVQPYTRALLEASPVPDPEVQAQRRAARNRQQAPAAKPGARPERDGMFVR